MNNIKDLYIDNSLIGSHQGHTLFDDVYIEHNSLPEINLADIDTTTEFMGSNFSFPLIISSMIGGTERGLEINEILVNIAQDLNIPIELGSQQENIASDEQSKLYLSEIDDDLEKNVFILSNLSAKASEEDVKIAMDQVKANALSLYINAAQEAVSFDHEADFEGVLANIEKLVSVYGDKVLVKEKAMGMSQETVKKLVSAGVNYIDLSGYGGTNFIEIENLRNYRNDFSDMYGWGIPTAKSILNARVVSQDVKIIASGGIKTSMDIIKALILGADYVAVAGELLRYLVHGGYDHAKAYLEGLIKKTKILMFLLGARNLEELKRVPYKLTGKLKEISEWQILM